MRFAHIATLVLASAPTSALFAWGEAGHQIVAKIAELRIKDSTKQRIEAIYQAEKAIEPQVVCDVKGAPPAVGPEVHDPARPLASVALYPDHIKRLPKGDGTGNWHFIDMDHDDSAAGMDLAKYCGRNLKLKFSYDAERRCYRKNPRQERRDDDCSTVKGDELFRVLADGHADPVQRVEAVKFFVHILGDLHQPLHNADWHHDAGGNGRAVFFFDDPDSDFGPGIHRPLNLHTIWDDNMVDRSIKTDRQGGKSSGPITTAEIDTYAAKLNAAFEKNPHPEWLEGGLLDWAWEAHSLANTVAYKGFVAENVPLTFDTETVDPKLRVTVASDKDPSYYDDGQGHGARYVIDEQMLKGGVRLAALLDAAFD